MKKKIINLFLCLVVLVSVGFSTMGCDQPPPAALEKQSDDLTASTPSTAGKVWPYIAQQKDSVLAENLLSKNFVVILDGSGSMSESDCAGSERKITVAKNAIIEWAKTISSDANLGLIAFHGDWTTMDLSPMNQAKAFAVTIAQVEPGGYTPLATAMKLAYGMLTKQAQRQIGYGEYTIVVVTDGGDNDRRESLEKWVRHILNNTPIRIYTIGFCIQGNHDLNQPGRMIYKDANNPEELRKGLKDVLAEAESFNPKVFSK